MAAVLNPCIAQASLTFAGAASLWLTLRELWALGLAQQVLVAVLATAAVLSAFHTYVHGCNCATGRTCRRWSWLLAGCTVLAAGVMCACWSDSVAGAFNILSWPLIRLLRLLATPVVAAAQSIAALVDEERIRYSEMRTLFATAAAVAAADKDLAKVIAAEKAMAALIDGAFTPFRLLTLHANAAAAAAAEAVTGTSAAVVTAWCNTTEDASRGGPMELLQLLVLLPARTMMPLTVCAVSTVRDLAVCIASFVQWVRLSCCLSAALLLDCSVLGCVVGCVVGYFLSRPNGQPVVPRPARWLYALPRTCVCAAGVDCPQSFQGSTAGGGLPATGCPTRQQLPSRGERRRSATGAVGQPGLGVFCEVRCGGAVRWMKG